MNVVLVVVHRNAAKVFYIETEYGPTRHRTSQIRLRQKCSTRFSPNTPV